ncbi:hypothetical protein ACHAWF_016129 [Thalassiosira exigua]
MAVIKQGSTPFLPAGGGECPRREAVTSTNEQELTFYDPTSILVVPKEVALGYLILLTGGATGYKAPNITSESSASKSASQSSTNSEHQSPCAEKSSAPDLDEDSASLAYAAIVDGNVLYTCFGLKAGANGRISQNFTPKIGSKNKLSTSIFCCFPSSESLQMVLPHAAKNKLWMQNLAEILREVRDLHYETLLLAPAGSLGSTKRPLLVQVIEAYIHCFAAIVRYHDDKKFIGDDRKSDGDSKQNAIVACCSKVAQRLNRLLSKRKINPLLERLQQDSLKDIENGFRGLREAIWESLEKVAGETAFTGVTVED